MWKLIALIVLLTLVQHGACESLTVTTLNHRLPAPKAYFNAVYDLDDRIYLVGGAPARYANQVIKYEISHESDPFFGLTSGLPTTNGSVAWGGRETLYYLESTPIAPSRFWKLTLDSSRTQFYQAKQLGSLDEIYARDGSIVSDNRKYVYIVGGVSSITRPLSDKIYRISTRIDQIEDVVRMPSPRIGAKSVYDNGTGSIYIFGGSGYREVDAIAQYNIKTGTFSAFDVKLPVNLEQVVWVGTYALLYHSDPTGRTRGWQVSKWSPATGDQITPVDLMGDATFIRPHSASVYVDKLQRVYVFGGHKNERVLEDDIAVYIDLSQADSAAIPRTPVQAVMTITVGQLLVLGIWLWVRSRPMAIDEN